MKRDTSRLTLAGLTVAVLCLGILTGCDRGDPMTTGGRAEAAPTGTAAAAPWSFQTQITRVIDGDTVAVAPIRGVLEPNSEDAADHAVRILGIDAPEMNYGHAAGPECGARQATGRLEQTLPLGMPVSVEYDLEADRTDRYGRSLAYVTTRGGVDAGLQQVDAGYAVAWYPAGEPEPERFQAYRKAAGTAVSQGLGAQAECEATDHG